LEVVATDMGSPFIKSARDNQPDAVNVVDHFHVIKLYNEKLTQLRRDMQRDAETAQGKKVLKGIRWLLMLKPDNLAKKKDSAKQRLDDALELNKPLATAYDMKEELRVIWQQDSTERMDQESRGNRYSRGEIFCENIGSFTKNNIGLL